MKRNVKIIPSSLKNIALVLEKKNILISNTKELFSKRKKAVMNSKSLISSTMISASFNSK